MTIAFAVMPASAFSKSPAVAGIAGDVRVLPGPQQRQQIVGVLGQEEAFQK